MAVGGGSEWVITAKLRCDSFHWDVESWLSGELWGVLDGQQLFVVEGSDANLFVMLCRHWDRISSTRA